MKMKQKSFDWDCYHSGACTLRLATLKDSFLVEEIQFLRNLITWKMIHLLFMVNPT